MTATRVIGPYLLRDTMNAKAVFICWKITCGLSYLAGKTSMNLFSCTMAHRHTALSVHVWLDQKLLFPVGLGKEGVLHFWVVHPVAQVCYEEEQKLSAIRFLHNRNNTYPLNSSNKQKELRTIQQILLANNYEPDFIPKLTHANHTPDTQSTNGKRWSRFTYIGKETRYITKLFKNSNIGIAYTTKDNLQHLLHGQPKANKDIYDKSGVYKLTCTDCNRQYIGQTGRPFHICYKEHAREYKFGTNKSNFAKHLLDNKHTLQPIHSCMSILHTTTKGPALNTLERFYIHQATTKDIQLNDKNASTPNPIFDIIMRFNRDNAPRFRTY